MPPEIMKEVQKYEPRRVVDGGAGVVGRFWRTQEGIWIALRSLVRCASALVAIATLPAMSAGFNDTGIVACADINTLSANCAAVSADSGSFPRQDARYGRAAMNPVSNGFDFSKIAIGGAVLLNNATEWACVGDNVTGLTWETKAVSGLRSRNHTYSWYSSAPANAGGTATAGSCATVGRCDTEKFVADVNAMSPPLCGYIDWRLPTAKELQGIVNFSRINPATVISFFSDFPAVGAGLWWTSTRSASSGDAWFVDFSLGGASTWAMNNPLRVRLVRSAP